MKQKKIAWVGGVALVFFLLPPLGMKIWDYLIITPWPQKIWLVYLVMGIGLVGIVRLRLRRLRRKEQDQDIPSESQLIYLAKERLVKGEITPEQYREIRKELKEA